MEEQALPTPGYPPVEDTSSYNPLTLRRTSSLMSYRRMLLYLALLTPFSSTCSHSFRHLALPIYFLFPPFDMEPNRQSYLSTDVNDLTITVLSYFSTNPPATLRFPRNNPDTPLDIPQLDHGPSLEYPWYKESPDAMVSPLV